jgi:cell division protein FtsB
MSLLQRKTLTIALMLFVAWIGYRAWQVRVQRTRIAGETGDLELRVHDLERNNQFLASSSAYFSSDAYLERQARLKLNYKLPGEEVAFVYKDSSVKSTPAAQEFKVKLSDFPNWKKWWYYLLGY